MNTNGVFRVKLSSFIMKQKILCHLFYCFFSASKLPYGRQFDMLSFFNSDKTLLLYKKFQNIRIRQKNIQREFIYSKKILI